MSPEISLKSGASTPVFKTLPTRVTGLPLKVTVLVAILRLERGFHRGDDIQGIKRFLEAFLDAEYAQEERVLLFKER